MYLTCIHISFVFHSRYGLLITVFLMISSDEEFVDLEKDFEKNIVNSAVYIISVSLQISNFAVNYKVSSKLYTHWREFQKVEFCTLTYEMR